MTSVLRFLFVTGCMVQLLFVSTVFATADQQPRAGVSGYCFRQRTPIGQRGRCTDEIRPSDQTTLSDAKDCCLLGGVGWTTKTNGKRCENACEGEPYKKDVQPLETPVTHEDKTDFRNDSNNTAKVLLSEWGDWQNCTESCGVGNMTRYRTCIDSAEHCNGSSEETIPCNSTISCQDIGNATWSVWGDWQNCTSPCGVGNMTRYRTCIDSAEHCNGSSEETIPCNSTISCQDIGNATWSVWGDWQNCTVPCGVGNMTRYRTCNGGENCNGSSEETIPCDGNITCQVNGRWTAWNEWSACNPCDSNAKTTRSRSCTNPPPSGGGSNCSGLQSMTRNCPGNCPDQNNGWSEWSDWTPCSAQCGKQGYSLRSRSCTRVPPQNCIGNYIDINTCTGTTNCPTSR